MLFAGNLAGKVIGLGREVLLAALFGASRAVDAFRAAQTATLIPVQFVSSEALNAGFIPLYSRYRSTDPVRASTLFAAISLILLGLSIGLSTAIVIGAEHWVSILVPGFDTVAHEMAVSMLRIMAIGVPLYIAAFLLVVLDIGHGHYVLASTRSSFQSVGLIVGTVSAYLLSNITMLAWGFVGGYAAFLVVGWIRTRSMKYILAPPYWSTPLAWNVLAEFWRVLRPLLLLPVFLQANIVIERIVASFLGVGVLASFEYAKTLTETGAALIAVPLGIAGLSQLSRLGLEEAKNELRVWLPFLFLVLIPISLLIGLNSRAVVNLIFGYGSFDRDAVDVTAAVLTGLAAGMWAQVVAYVLIKALNSQYRNREAALISVLGFTLNAAFNVIAYRWVGPITLGLGASISAVVMLIASLRALTLLKQAAQMVVRIIPAVGLYLCVHYLLGAVGIDHLLINSLLMLALTIGVAAYGPVFRDSIRQVLREVFSGNRGRVDV